MRLVEMLQQLGEIISDDQPRLLLQRLLRELHAPRRVRLQIAVFDRRFEDALEQHPRIPNRLPPRTVPELLGHPLLKGAPVDVPQRRLPPGGQNVETENGLVLGTSGARCRHGDGLSAMASYAARLTRPPLDEFLQPLVWTR
jgi:hypothetical protein